MVPLLLGTLELMASGETAPGTWVLVSIPSTPSVTCWAGQGEVAGQAEVEIN